MTPMTSSGVKGSNTSRSAVSKSVETVSGLLLTITTSYPAFFQSPDAVDGGVVELDALPDADRAGTEHDYGFPFRVVVLQKPLEPPFSSS